VAGTPKSFRCRLQKRPNKTAALRPGLGFPSVRSINKSDTSTRGVTASSKNSSPRPPEENIRLDHRAEDASIKTESSYRRVPLHEQLLAEGLLHHVRGLPKDGPLFPTLLAGKFGSKGAPRRRNRAFRASARGEYAIARRSPVVAKPFVASSADRGMPSYPDPGGHRACPDRARPGRHGSRLWAPACPSYGENRKEAWILILGSANGA
jgi:hypothetical protein